MTATLTAAHTHTMQQGRGGRGGSDRGRGARGNAGRGR